MSLLIEPQSRPGKTVFVKGFALPPEMHEYIIVEAKRLGVSRSEFIRALVRGYRAEQEQ